MQRIFIIFGLVGLLTSCAASNNYAPVVNANDYPIKQAASSQPITAEPIVLAEEQPPVRAKPITPVKKKQEPSSKKSTVSQKPIVKEPAPKVVEKPVVKTTGWPWPAKGKIVANYSEATAGIDIAGEMGEPVVAVLPGEVIYSQTGLSGYGNTIIIQHKNALLTAYMHNSDLMVHVGETVSAGQKIASMGAGENNQGLLHFEVRESGQAVNPMKYLSAGE